MKLSEYVDIFIEIQRGEADINASMMTNSKLIEMGIDKMGHLDEILFYVQKRLVTITRH